MNDTNAYQGERLTFFQLCSEKDWDIEIPIIQRDYAQGRKSSQEVRDGFLTTLYTHLTENRNIDLDFVYGSVDKTDRDRFVPIDGQQRLTTLFLLHWYLSHKDGERAGFLEHFTRDGLSKFQYHTRESAKEFCTELSKRQIDLNNLLDSDENEKNCLSKTLRDREWYFSSWDNDPTVSGMMTMLDAIHVTFKDSSGLWARLLDVQNRVITFHFLNLEKFNLSDDLYIKMNARGKQLTSFENFKAKYEQFLKKQADDDQNEYTLGQGDGERHVSRHEYFKHKIDTAWSDLFWGNFRKEKRYSFDTEVMNLIRVIATNHYALKPERDEQKLKHLIESEDDISFMFYVSINSFDAQFNNRLISILDLLENGTEQMKTYHPDAIYYNEGKTLRSVIDYEPKTDLTYMKRILFYAFYAFLIRNKPSDRLESWIRIIYNLTENTSFDRQLEYERALRSVDALLDHSTSILEYFADQNNKIDGFLNLQIEEERIKAALILKDEDWEQAIHNLERHGYFRGQIGFVLAFSGIEEYFNIHSNCNWSEEENALFFEQFNLLSQKVKAIFNDKGLNTFPTFLWERALLSKGNYLLTKGSNASFLINVERNISWKRLLRDDNEGKRRFVQEVFDDPAFDISDLNSSLQRIIENATVEDWRRHFIYTPEVLKYISERNIRWNSEDSINLLKKKRLAAEHAEYFSYGFFLKHLRDKQFHPFQASKYYYRSGTEEEPCAYIDEWFVGDAHYAIDIKYLSHGQFAIMFFNRNGEFIHDQIKSILGNNAFQSSNENKPLSYNRSEAETQVVACITALCEDLGELSI